MAIPISGEIGINTIKNELGYPTGNNSLRTMSNDVGFTTPDELSDFYGYPELQYQRIYNYGLTSFGGTSDPYDEKLFYRLQPDWQTTPSAASGVGSFLIYGNVTYTTTSMTGGGIGFTARIGNPYSGTTAGFFGSLTFSNLDPSDYPYTISNTENNYIFGEHDIIDEFTRIDTYLINWDNKDDLYIILNQSGALGSTSGYFWLTSNHTIWSNDLWYDSSYGSKCFNTVSSGSPCFSISTTDINFTITTTPGGT